MRIFPVAIVIVLLLLSPMVSAIETITIDQEVILSPLNPSWYNSTINWTDPANANLTNDNATVLPFMAESGIHGTITGAWTPPILYEVSDNTTFSNYYFTGLVKFKSDWVMSGSSYSWWRCPVFNITGWALLGLDIWHLSNPEFLNFTGESLTPNEAARPTLIYNNSYEKVGGYNQTWRSHNITAWNYSFNFIWVRVVAPLHSDESYVYRWRYSDLHAEKVRVMYSQCDIGDDHFYKSWFKPGTGYAQKYFPADYDCSIIHEYGMGEGVSGFDIGINVTLTFYSLLSTPITNGKYLTFMMPFIKDISTTNNIEVIIQNQNASFSYSWIVSPGANVDFTIQSILWNKAYSEDHFYIYIEFQNETNSIFIYDVNSNFNPFFDDDSAFATNHFEVSNHSWAPASFQFWFRPYYSLQITNGTWINTHLDPIYILDGRIVSLSDVRLKDTSAHYSWLVYCLVGFVMAPYYIYNIFDKIILFDMLPDLNRTRYIATVCQVIHRIIDIGDAIYKPLKIIGNFFVQLVKAIIKYAPYILAGIVKGLALIIFIPIFVFCILLVNGVKRFFVVLVSRGPEGAAEYAETFFQQVRGQIRGGISVLGRARVMGGNIVRRVIQ